MKTFGTTKIIGVDHGYQAMEDALAAGKVRAIGLSNFYEERFAKVMEYAKIATLLRDGTITEIAKAHGKTTAQIILRWELQSGIVAIPGSADEQHIRENLDIMDFELSMDEMARINALESRRFYDYSEAQAERMFTSWRPDYDSQK